MRNFAKIAGNFLDSEISGDRLKITIMGKEYSASSDNKGDRPAKLFGEILQKGTPTVLHAGLANLVKKGAYLGQRAYAFANIADQVSKDVGQAVKRSISGPSLKPT